MKHYSVVVVGAGPAGSACAINLEKKGIHCLVLEKRDKPIGKVCGDGLTARAIDLLKKTGIDPFEYPGARINRKIVYKEKNRTEISYLDLIGAECEYGISRDVLDSALIALACSNGVEVSMNHCCNSIIRRNNAYLIDGEIIADKVIIASGALSKPGHNKMGSNEFKCGVSSRVIGEIKQTDDAFTFFYSEKYRNGYAWVFPVGKHMWNIGVWGSAAHNMKQLYFEFEQKICRNVPFSYDRRPRGAIIGAGGKDCLQENGVFYIGDCSGGCDLQTGEGITYALSGAEKAADLIFKEMNSI